MCRERETERKRERERENPNTHAHTPLQCHGKPHTPRAEPAGDRLHDARAPSYGAHGAAGRARSRETPRQKVQRGTTPKPQILQYYQKKSFNLKISSNKVYYTA